MASNYQLTMNDDSGRGEAARTPTSAGQPPLPMPPLQDVQEATPATDMAPLTSGTHTNDIHHHIMNSRRRQEERGAKWEEVLLFFTSAVGCTLGWTSVLSNLVFYTDTLGVNSYLYLNVGIYAPMFPITIAQTLWDADFDREFTSLKSFGWRGSVGFGATILATLGMAPASLSHSLLYVTLLAFGLGTSSGILHGALKQMASFVYPGCGRLTAAVTAGLQASALVVLIVSLLASRCSTNQQNRLYIFYGIIAVLVGVSWIGFQRLMTHSKDVYRSMIRRDSSIQLAAMPSSGIEDEGVDDYETTFGYATDGNTDPDNHLDQPLLLNQDTAPSFDLHDSMPTMRQQFYQTWPLCLATFLTVASSMAVASWFNRVPSANPNLPQVLFYTRLFSDLLARPATLWLPREEAATPDNSNDNNNFQRRSLVGLLMLTFVRLLFVPYFFWYTLTTQRSTYPNSTLHGDIAMVLGVFGFAFSSGFVTTWIYQLAPRYCRTAQGHLTDSDAILLQQTNLLNVWFSGSVLVGVVGSLVLTSISMS